MVDIYTLNLMKRKKLFKLLAVYASGNVTIRRKWYKLEYPYNLSPNLIIGDFNIKSEAKKNPSMQKKPSNTKLLL